MKCENAVVMCMLCLMAPAAVAAAGDNECAFQDFDLYNIFVVIMDQIS